MALMMTQVIPNGPPGLTFTGCLSSWGGVHPVDKQVQCTLSAVDETLNPRRESFSESSCVLAGWGAYCFHSCFLNISQSPVRSTRTLENHLIHFSANSVPSWRPEGARFISTMWSGTARNQKRSGCIKERMLFIYFKFETKRGSREIWSLILMMQITALR